LGRKKKGGQSPTVSGRGVLNDPRRDAAVGRRLRGKVKRLVIADDAENKKRRLMLLKKKKEEGHNCSGRQGRDIHS